MGLSLTSIILHRKENERLEIAESAFLDLRLVIYDTPARHVSGREPEVRNYKNKHAPAIALQFGEINLIKICVLQRTFYGISQAWARLHMCSRAGRNCWRSIP